MDRRNTLLALLALGIGRRSVAQQAAKVHRVGFVAAGTASGSDSSFDAFRQGLRQLGYVEGSNVVIEARLVDGRLERLPELAAELIRLKVDVLVAGSPAAAAKQASTNRALAAIAASGAQALIVTTDPFLFTARGTLVSFAASKRLPAMYFFKNFVDAGGLMSYGANIEESYRRAATYVDKILKGAKPRELPVEQPTRFELIVNRRTAKALDLVIPQSMLLRADKVIE